jgi:hypothetical protein
MNLQNISMSIWSRKFLTSLCLLVILGMTVSCLPFFNGPDIVTRKNFEEWAKNVGITYRNASYKVTSTDETSASVEITVEAKMREDDSWEEYQTTVRLTKPNNEWKAPTSFALLPSPRTLKTRQAVQDITATVAVAQQQATSAVRQTAINATAALQATRLAESQQQANANATVSAATATAIQRTRIAEATQQASIRATASAERTIFINKTLTMQTIERDSSAFRSYYKEVEFILVGVEQADANSLLWNFYLWNHNTRGEFGISDGRTSYVVSSDGKKYNALAWNDVQTVAGERKDFTIAFNAPTRSGETYKLFLFTNFQSRDFYYVFVQWQPFEVKLK